MGKKTEPVDPELRPDGWERFEKAVDIALKTPAVHRTAEGEDDKHRAPKRAIGAGSKPKPKDGKHK